MAILGALLAVAMGLGAYWVAERRGRAAERWLALVAGIVFGSYYATHLAAGAIAGTNAIFGATTGVAAMATVLAGPVVGLAIGLALIRWLSRAPVLASPSAPLSMFGGWGDGEMTEVTLRIEPDTRALVLTRGSDVERIERGRIASAEVDGAYLIVGVAGESRTLRVRPIGDAYREREQCVAQVELLAHRLLERG